MSIHIYNSLSKTKEEFVPLDAKNVTMYSCGVTVYDQCHIGHARSLYIFDIIKRYLRYRGFHVHFVRNITDVDDKIINKAKELKQTSDEVASAHIALYQKDLQSLGIAQADDEPRATGNIPEMITHIEALIQKDYAYPMDGDVYFKVRRFNEYGKLSGQSIDQMLEGVRIEPDARKKDPLDFALWKKSSDEEPGWSSPWGRGRPGWHIECSCMSMKYLKTQTLDIHAGGRDLIFPHHENEIAQSESLTGKPFAKVWIHHGLLTIRGQKMAKSLKNFITIQEVLKKYSADELKFLFLSSHYASPVDFTDEKMNEAHKALERIKILIKRAASRGKSKIGEPKKSHDEEKKFIDEYKQKFIMAMDDDFNTPQALACLFDLVTQTNRCLDRGFEVASDAVETIKELCSNIFGLSFDRPQDKLSEDVEGLLSERKNARANKDFKRCDELRHLLKVKGILVEDTKEGQVWRRE